MNTSNVIKIGDTTILDLNAKGNFENSSEENILVNSSEINITLDKTQLKIDTKKLDQSNYDNKNSKELLKYINDNSTTGLYYENELVANGSIIGNLMELKDLNIQLNFTDGTKSTADVYFNSSFDEILSQLNSLLKDI